MLDIIKKAAKEEEIRKRFYFTLLMLVVYRLGNNIPIPFIDSKALADAYNIETLNAFEDGTEVTPELLFANKFLNKNKAKAGVKILGDGELNKKLTVKAHKFTKSAVEKIEKAGGSIEVIETTKWVKPSKKA